MAIPTAEELVRGYKAGGNLTAEQIVGKSPTLATAQPTVAGLNNMKAENPNATMDTFTNQTLQRYATNPTITSEMLSGNPTPLNLTTPQTPISTIGAGITGAATSKADSIQNEIAQMETDIKTQAESEVEKSKSVWARITGDKKAILEDKITALNTPEVLAQKEAKLKTLQSLRQSQQAERNEKDAVMKQSMLTDVQKQQKWNEITNRYALQNANLSLSYDIARGDYDSATETINQVAQLKTEALQPEIDYIMAFLQNNLSNLSKAEQGILQTKKDQLEALQKQQEQDTKDNYEAMIRYNSLGAGITTNDTAEQRAQKIAKVGGELAYTQASFKKTEGEKTTPLGILDVQRYNELYPDAGIVAGDTEAVANLKVNASNTPEAKTRNLIISAKDAGNDYKTVVKEINSDTTIKDKATAIKIADEVYDKTKTNEVIIGSTELKTKSKNTIEASPTYGKSLIDALSYYLFQ